MRLLVDAHVFDEAPQGSRTYIKGLYAEVINARDPSFEIYICARNTQLLQEEFGIHPHVTYVKLNSSSSLFRLAIEFPRLIKKYAIDVAHFQYITPLFSPCKIVVTVHDVLFLDYPQYFPILYRIYRAILFKWCAKHADLVLTVSESSKSSIARHFNIPVDKIVITPNAVSKHFFEELAPGREKALKARYKLDKFLLYTSRIEPRKNQLILLRAFYELGLWKKGIDLVFIGRVDIAAGEFMSYLDGLETTVRQHVRILDNISFDEINTFYKCCSMFVYPSLVEGFGIPPLEAAAAGCLVLCSNGPAMKDFYFFGGNFFNPEDLGELKHKIIDGLTGRDENDIQEIRSIVRARYDWNIVAKNFLERLKQTLL